MNGHVTRVAAPIAGAVTGLAAWEATVRGAGLEPYELPAPTRVGRALVAGRHVLPQHATSTLTVAVGGLALGALVGVLVAVLLAAVPLLRLAVQPLLVASQSVPAVVLAPVFIVWFGFGLLPRLLVVALVVFFPITITTMHGLADADPDLVELVRANGGSSWHVLRRVRVPHTVGALCAGLRIAAAYAMFAAVVAEYMGGATHGLGLYLLRSQRSFRNDQVFAAIAIIAAVSLALYGAVAVLGRLATPWRAAHSDAGAPR